MCIHKILHIRRLWCVRVCVMMMAAQPLVARKRLTYGSRGPRTLVWACLLLFPRDFFIVICYSNCHGRLLTGIAVFWFRAVPKVSRILYVLRITSFDTFVSLCSTSSSKSLATLKTVEAKLKAYWTIYWWNIFIQCVIDTSAERRHYINLYQNKLLLQLIYIIDRCLFIYYKFQSETCNAWGYYYM